MICKHFKALPVLTFKSFYTHAVLIYGFQSAHTRSVQTGSQLSQHMSTGPSLVVSVKYIQGNVKIHKVHMKVVSYTVS